MIWAHLKNYHVAMQYFIFLRSETQFCFEIFRRLCIELNKVLKTLKYFDLTKLMILFSVMKRDKEIKVEYEFQISRENFSFLN